MMTLTNALPFERILDGASEDFSHYGLLNFRP